MMESVRKLRLVPLNDWLVSVHAKKLWGTQNIGLPSNPNHLAAYQVNGHILIVQFLGDGWQIYLPASKVNSITADLEAAAAFCGVQGEPS
jgi:hypothetical protein